MGILKHNIRVAFLKPSKGQQKWADGQNIGNHAKFFIIDDLCYYLGSQNLYICNLAEWGVVVDDETETKKVLEAYWNPLWENSYHGQAFDFEEVMKQANVNRDGPPRGAIGKLADVRRDPAMLGPMPGPHLKRQHDNNVMPQS